MSLEQEEARCAEGRTAPRVSLSNIEDAIDGKLFFTADEVAADTMTPFQEKALRVLTVCIVVMKNGFTIIGKAAPASPENFDAELGKDLAYQDAVRQIWPLMGFALRDRLHNASNPQG